MWFPKSPLQWGLVAAGVLIVLSLILDINRAIWPTAIILLVYVILYKMRNAPDHQGIHKAKPDKDSGFVEASYEVPYCKFQHTPEGFIVSFNAPPLGFHKVLHATSTAKSGGQAATALVALAGIGAFRLAQKGGKGTVIEVTRDAVIIDGKKMRRGDFGSFHVSSTYKGNHLDSNVAVLGYSYGSQSFEFGGAWGERQANEVASSLNTHLRAAPLAGDETRASPEALRAARPTDF
ncbi:hypothetical protein FBZ89_14211 [Nitrospirillum amazonense]|uniref:Uncharacterized protein n=1 Tax=Nitrospirillum amazonense TaxID=28077 RepID=A0A560EJ08_9PROT|nr:hypothetical protein [Nitrospirillum amazonense]TWB09327.1 hypothetical protein FBZ89_14211 [Nitrospirillum amazonense]